MLLLRLMWPISFQHSTANLQTVKPSRSSCSKYNKFYSAVCKIIHVIKILHGAKRIEEHDFHQRILKISVNFQVGWTLYCGPPESSAKMKKIEKSTPCSSQYFSANEQCFSLVINQHKSNFSETNRAQRWMSAHKRNIRKGNGIP